MGPYNLDGGWEGPGMAAVMRLPVAGTPVVLRPWKSIKAPHFTQVRWYPPQAKHTWLIVLSECGSTALIAVLLGFV